MSFLHIENYSKRFGENVIYSNFNLAFDAPEWVFLTGESGRGKTVLLKAIKNKEPGINTFERSIRYISQQPIVFNWMTVEQNIKFGNKDISKYDEILNILQITDLTNRYPNEISGGQCQRVSLARALLEPRDIYLFDESLSSVDFMTTKNIMRAIKSLLINNLCIFVTHQLKLNHVFTNDYRLIRV